MVSDQEKAAEFRGLLFDNMPLLATRPYAELAAKAGLPVGLFEKALAAKAGSERIAEDVALGERVGVTGSGKMYFEGRRLDHWKVPSRLSRDGNDRSKTTELWRRLLGMPASMPASQPAG